MAMAPQRSNPLHNFDIPMSWGNPTRYKCVNPNGEISQLYRKSSREEEFVKRGSTDLRESYRRSPSPASFASGSGLKFKLRREGGEGIVETRAKLTFDLRMETDKMKGAILREGFEERHPPENDESRPWNLRKRRAACNNPSGGSNGGGSKTSQFDLMKPNFSPRFRISGPSLQSSEKKERVEFSVSLSKKEIEHDFLMICGNKLPRRPKKRPKNIQKDLDMVFPGLSLTGINADKYKVPDAPDTAKR